MASAGDHTMCHSTWFDESAAIISPESRNTSCSSEFHSCGSDSARIPTAPLLLYTEDITSVEEPADHEPDHEADDEEEEDEADMAAQRTERVYEDALGSEVFPRRRKPRVDGRPHRHRTVAIQCRPTRDSWNSPFGCKSPARKDQCIQCSEHYLATKKKRKKLGDIDRVRDAEDSEDTSYSSVDMDSHHFEPEVPDQVDCRYYPRGYVRRPSLQRSEDNNNNSAAL